MTETEFNRLAAEGYNRLPLTLETFADLDTPLSIYLKLADAPNSFLLESVVGGERFGRYSFIGLPAHTLLRVRESITEVVSHGAVIERHEGNPLDFLEQYQARCKVHVPVGFPRFCGGLAGYFGYDTIRYIESKLAGFDHPDEIGMPDILLLQSEELAVIDNLASKIYLIVYVDPALPAAYAQGQARLQQLLELLRGPLTLPQSRPSPATLPQRDFRKEDYLAAVLRAKEYIAAGDMMQVQIGQRIKQPFSDSPLTLYRALRSLNPSPYMYYYDFGDFQVVGASPEILVRQESSGSGTTKVTIRPLAGTRPRGADPQQDRHNAEELLSDPKERAEHVMLIDLARNDIGRIAETGSVKVTDQMVIERYSHVMHIVSNVEGVLKPGTSNLDVLRATFPAGTLTGAPKVRAMEIIDELEPIKRGLYGGACGYLSFSGEMDLAIAIRTGIVKQGMLYVQAAAGIVADSVPESEWQETENKARALLRAAEQVQAGLDHVP
ncbi:MAG: anthranilate synthase component I [Pseudomonadales bacterium]|nr:anthranilate synthase component I [Pseudomonadales bacterium]MCP5333887.1 anthranilate synthase component I [Pseudomonadales bacterium]HMU90148.1 anthranilate synthase component I [Pseudomonadales bacterium]HNB83256.1 anthranilate synthase component I [Pseudomonadales bacterium]HNL23918.1 anthranilate synthase component I [Pseudomonadales bacterium]